MTTFMVTVFFLKNNLTKSYTYLKLLVAWMVYLVNKFFQQDNIAAICLMFRVNFQTFLSAMKAISFKVKSLNVRSFQPLF